MHYCDSSFRLSVKAGWNWVINEGNDGNAGNHGENVGNQGGNAGKRGGNAGVQGGNAENRVWECREG